MIGRHERRQQERLDAVWDGLIAGNAESTARDPSADLAQPLRRLSQLDDAPAPSAAFVARLRADLHRRATATAPEAAVPSDNRRSAPVAAPAVGAHRQLGRSWSTAGRHFAAQFVTAAVLVVIVAGGLALFRPSFFGSGGPPPTSAAPSLAALAATQGQGGEMGCDVAPRSRASFIAALATPRPGTFPPAPATPVPMPVGRPADAATIAAVTRTAEELTACLNAGDVARYYALWTDAMLRHVAARQPSLLSNVLAAIVATPTPPPVDYAVLFEGLSEVRVLPDGRVGARILWRYEDRPGPTPYTIFAQRGGRYLVDDSLYVLPTKEELGPPPATPNATPGRR